jgi:hypothetical protein
VPFFDVGTVLLDGLEEWNAGEDANRTPNKEDVHQVWETISVTLK